MSGASRPSRPRALFFGTPEFAVPGLRALAEVADVTLVVTQPDRPKGRGMKLAPPPVKVLAEQLGIPVVQPTKIRTPEFAESLRAQQADVALVIAYGRILPNAVLAAPRIGCLNVHASLLPKLRGAAPIQWSIVRGERETGVCLMGVEEGLDTGPVYARESLIIGRDETSAELSLRLSELGANVVRSELPRVVAGELIAEPQDHARATLAPILSKQDGEVDWTRPARELHDLARGFAPWPSAFTWVSGTDARLKLHRTLVLEEQGAHGQAGEVVAATRDGIDVACGAGVLRILELQAEGARRLGAAEFLVGQRLAKGTQFVRKPEAS
jgi:methionyl-tRNA formyltransferase